MRQITNEMNGARAFTNHSAQRLISGCSEASSQQLLKLFVCEESKSSTPLSQREIVDWVTLNNSAAWDCLTWCKRRHRRSMTPGKEGFSNISGILSYRKSGSLGEFDLCEPCMQIAWIVGSWIDVPADNVFCGAALNDGHIICHFLCDSGA